MPTSLSTAATSARFQFPHVEPSAKNKTLVPEDVVNFHGPTSWLSNDSLNSIRSSESGRICLDDDDVYRAAYREPLARSNPLDSAPRPPGPCAAHVLAVDTSLAPLLNAWSGLDAGVAAARSTAGRGALQVSDLYHPQQVRAALSPRDTHTRAVLGDMGVPAAIVSAVLDGKRSAGGRAIMDACRLLSMPEVREHEQVKATLDRAVRRYIESAGGDYAGTYRALGDHSHDECKALATCIEDCVAAIGPQQVRDRLLKDMAPAILDTMARKNPGVCAGELRGRLAELLNVQGFSGYKALMDGATGRQLLQVVELLPNFIESAEKAARPPANGRDAAPPTAVRPVADPVADVERILKALQGVLPPIHIGNIGNNNGNNNGFRGKDFGNAKIEGPMTPLGSFERLAPRDEPPVDRPVVHTEQRATAPVPVAEEEHDEQSTIEDTSSSPPSPPPPPPPPPPPYAPPVHRGTGSTPLDAKLRAAHQGVINELMARQENGGSGLKAIRTDAAAAYRADIDAARIAALSIESEDTYRNGDVPLVEYGGARTQYLNTVNQYMKAPIKLGATPDSTFLFFGESRRNNVAVAVPFVVAPAAEEAGHASSGAGSPTTLSQVKIAWDAKVARDRFGQSIAEPIASKPQ